MSDVSDGLYRTFFEAAPDGVVVVDVEGIITDANGAAAAMFGYGREDLLGRPVEVLVPEALREPHEDHRRGFAASPHARPMGAGLELRGRRKDGGEVPVEISLSSFDVDGELSIIATVRDITDRKRLRDFGAGALRASEDERQRIARELHDDTAQHLATLLVRLKILERSGFESDWVEAVRSVREELKACAEGVRRIARGLRPPELEDAGVVAALRAHLRSMGDGAEMRLAFEADPVDTVLTPDAKLVLYRVVQEAVSNAVRHSGGSEVTVRVHRNGKNVVGEVEDDGNGFQLDRVSHGELSGLGLVGMHERAGMVGGRVSIESDALKGTRVRIRIPVEFHGEGKRV